MASKFVIRYRYPGTLNHRPVGVVYAEDISYISPGSWSYSKDPQEATKFDSEEDAERAMRNKNWPEATVVRLSQAKVLA
jgi:hypothetical protein